MIHFNLKSLLNYKKTYFFPHYLTIFLLIFNFIPVLFKKISYKNNNFN